MKDRSPLKQIQQPLVRRGKLVFVVGTLLVWNSTSSGMRDLGGVLIRFPDLGISAGTTIYGCSLMAGDLGAQISRAVPEPSVAA